MTMSCLVLRAELPSTCTHGNVACKVLRPPHLRLQAEALTSRADDLAPGAGRHRVSKEVAVKALQARGCTVGLAACSCAACRKVCRSCAAAFTVSQCACGQLLVKVCWFIHHRPRREPSRQHAMLHMAETGILHCPDWQACDRLKYGAAARAAAPPAPAASADRVLERQGRGRNAASIPPTVWPHRDALARQGQECGDWMVGQERQLVPDQLPGWPAAIGHSWHAVDNFSSVVTRNTLPRSCL